MGTRKNKTRLGEWDFTIQKPMANDIVMRNGLFVALEDGYIIPADGTTAIEGCAINDLYSGENNEHRYCVYQPKRNRETFTMEIDNGTISQEDVGKTFRIADSTLQHINYSTKANTGGQFRLEEVLNDTLGTFTYNFDTQFAPQGPQGNDGETPTLVMGTVTKLQPGENPTATLEQDGTTYTLNLGLPVGATGAKGETGDTGEKGSTGNSGTDGADGSDGADGADGEDGITPTFKGVWSASSTYSYLSVVRAPDTTDTDNTYRTWVWTGTDDATYSNVPSVDSKWIALNRDGDTGAQGEQGGTIVVPVEGKPGKDGIGVDGKDGDDGVSPHNEGTWSSTTNYSALAMVRAWTGTYNVFGDEIRGYYITKNGAYGTEPYQDTNNRQLVVQDGNGIASAKTYADGLYDDIVGFRNNVMMLSKATGTTVTKTFSNGGVMEPTTVQFSNRWGTTDTDKIDKSGTNIIINQDGYYRVFAHTILQCNPSTSTPYINMGRMSIYKNDNIALGTSKQGGPFISTQVTSGLWLDLTLDVIVPLFEGDTLKMLTRCQSDADNADGNSGTYVIIGQNDDSGSSGSGSLGGSLATYMGVELISTDLTNMGTGTL